MKAIKCFVAGVTIALSSLLWLNLNLTALLIHFSIGCVIMLYSLKFK